MRRAGVTLIELIVALTVIAALFAAGSAAVGVLLDRQDAALARLDEDLAAATIRSTLLEWLAGIQMPPESSRGAFQGADATQDGRPNDELSFVTSAATPLGARLTRVRLWIDRDPATPEAGLTAEFTEWLGTASLRTTLVAGAVGLDVRFRSNLLGRQWHPSWISTTVLPLGVELSILGGDGPEVPPLLILPIRTAIQGGR